MMYDQLKLALQRTAQQLLQEEGHDVPGLYPVTIEHPPADTHAQYSTNLAMQLVRTLKRNPQLIAQTIRERLLQDPDTAGWFTRIEIAPPGFINFHVSWPYWIAHRPAGLRNRKVEQTVQGKALIEHTSINPNKSAHIGHLRNSCIGDTLARLLRYDGYEVEVHNYIDDLGNQLADTVVGLLQTKMQQAHTRFGDFCWDVYAAINRAYKANPALEQMRAQVLHQLETGNNNTAWLGLLVAERIVREHLDDMKQFGIDYDVLVWESSIVREGFWEETFQKLQQTAVFQQETDGKLAGCWVLKQEQEQEEGEQQEYQSSKVLVRSNGILTYTAKDIAYHMWKFGLLDKQFRYQPFGSGVWSTHAQGTEQLIGQATRVINVIDHRQEYPQQMVKQALLALGYEAQAEQLQHVSYGVVSLSRATAAQLGVHTEDGRASYPMSGRQGIGIKVADLVDRMEAVIEAKRSQHDGLDSRSIATASIRYYLLKFHLQTEVVFDLEQATEITGNTGVYVMYAYARACSMLDKGLAQTETKQVPDAASVAAYAAQQQLAAPEQALLTQLLYGPETMSYVTTELAPNVLCTYTHELATLFNHFYATCSILKADSATRQFRLWLTETYRQTMHEALTLLGLPTPARM